MILICVAFINIAGVGVSGAIGVSEAMSFMY